MKPERHKVEIRVRDIPVVIRSSWGCGLDGTYRVGLWGKNVPGTGRGRRGMGTVLEGRYELETGTVATSRGILVYGVRILIHVP